MRNTFRADANRSASRQEFPRGDKGLLVLRHVLAFVLAPVNRQRVDSFNEITYKGHAKQWRLGQKRNLSRREAKQEHGIDKGVWVIEYENDGGFEWDVFETGDLNTLEVDPQREPYEGDYQATNHCSAILGHKEAQKAQILKRLTSLICASCASLWLNAIIPGLSQLISKSICSRKIHEAFCCYRCCLVGWAMLARRGPKSNLRYRRPAQGASRQRSAGFS